jgi:sugar lactone lactonase YvrE
MLAPSGIAVAPNGSVYVTDSGNQEVLHFSATGRFLQAWGGWGDGNGQFDGPSGIAVAPNGTVFVADTLNSRIESFTPNGTYLQQGSVPYPEQIQLQTNGSILVTNYREKTFTLSHWPSFVATLPGDPHPTAVTFAGDGSYYEALQNGSVIHFSAKGSVLGQWTIPPVPGNHKPSAITELSVDGNVVYALDSLYNRILVLFPTTAHQTGVVGWLQPGGQGVLGPRAMAIAPDGSIWVADTDDHEIVHVARDGTILATFQDPDSPYGIALGPNSLWVSGYYGGVLSQYTFTGRLIAHFFNNGSEVNALHRPTELLADGNNWVIWDRGDSRVVLVSHTGQVLASVSDTLGSPVSMSLTPQGEVAFLNSSGQIAVYQFGPTLSASTTVNLPS